LSKASLLSATDCGVRSDAKVTGTMGMG
jgi:hypothetical protein